MKVRHKSLKILLLTAVLFSITSIIFFFPKLFHPYANLVNLRRNVLASYNSSVLASAAFDSSGSAAAEVRPSDSSAKFYPQVGGKPCVDNKNRVFFKAMLSEWHRFAEKHGIEYMLSFGSLIGQSRNEDVIPWDGDVDVHVSYRYLPVLTAYSDKRDFKPGSDDKYRLITHPQFENTTVKYRTRWNCRGEVVKAEVDTCAFTTLIARWVYHSKHIDMYHLLDVGEMVYDATIRRMYNRTDVYPLVPCTFMGLQTWCPQNKKKLLQIGYGNVTKTSKVCKDGRWVSNARENRLKV